MNTIPLKVKTPEQVAKEADGWIEWNGGECPTAKEAVVDVRFRNGDIGNFAPAGSWFWGHALCQGDIIAYRLHNPEHTDCCGQPSTREDPTTRRHTLDGVVYELAEVGQHMLDDCNGCAFEGDAKSCLRMDSACMDHRAIWIKVEQGCCGMPLQCSQEPPRYHRAGRTTPGQPGGIASVPQSLEEVRYAADVRSDDWVKWGGGVMPVTGMVEVRYRNGVTNTDDADSFLWDHRDYPDDIVAYRISIPAPQYDPRDVSFNPLDRQVGGNHYRDMAIQPVQFIVANGIPYREANVIKYVVRHPRKNGKQDLLKARHYIDMLIADYEDEE